MEDSNYEQKLNAAVHLTKALIFDKNPDGSGIMRKCKFNDILLKKLDELGFEIDPVAQAKSSFKGKIDF